MSFPEIIRGVIDLARVASEEVETRLEQPQSGPVYSLDMLRLGPMTYRRDLREYLLGLPEDVISMITVIMYVGRGDFSIRDLSLHYQRQRERARFHRAEERVDRVAWKTPLPCYLEEGMRLLSKRGIDVDRLLRP
jgi:hypothetical protein